MIPTTYLSRLAFEDAWITERTEADRDETPRGGRLARAFARLLAASHPAVTMPRARSPRDA